MDRLSHTDFVLRNQPRLFVRALRAVLREDPAVLQCTAHRVDGAPDTYRLRIQADDPLVCLQRAGNHIKSALIAATLAGNTHSALPNA